MLLEFANPISLWDCLRSPLIRSWWFFFMQLHEELLRNFRCPCLILNNRTFSLLRNLRRASANYGIPWKLSALSDVFVRIFWIHLEVMSLKIFGFLGAASKSKADLILYHSRWDKECFAKSNNFLETFCCFDILSDDGTFIYVAN